MSEQNKIEYQAPTEQSVEKIKKFRKACKEFDHAVESILPASREKAITITRLEEVSMWGNKSIVFNQ